LCSEKSKNRKNGAEGLGKVFEVKEEKWEGGRGFKNTESLSRPKSGTTTKGKGVKAKKTKLWKRGVQL